MDDIMTTATPDTAPQDSGVATETPSVEADTSAAETDTNPAETETGEGTTPPENVAPTGEETGDDITYKFNHETKTLPLRDVPNLIQTLLKTQSDNEKTLDKMRYLAEASGKSLDELLVSLEDSFNKDEYNRFLQSTNGNEEIAQKLQEIAKKERAEKFKTTRQLKEEQELKDKEDNTRRMAEQLAALQEEFPEIKEFRDVPDSVVQEAVEKEVSLLDGYLRYMHRNTKKAETQKAAQQMAAAASSGSMRGEPEEHKNIDPQAAAFIAAFNSR